MGATPAYSDGPEYNGLNQQTKNAWWQTFSYDAAGNLTREWAEQLPSHALIPNRDYQYDMEGRLLTMSDPNVAGGYLVRFFYDGLGRRILQKVTNNGTTTYKRFLWCGQTLCQQRDTGTNSLRRYLATGEYVNAIGGNPAKKYVYFQDHLGSVRDLADATTGARVGALDYTPYGKVKASQPGGVLPDFQYAGLMWVGEVGLNASATRFYDGATTRWMTRDWIRESGGTNLYSYVGAAPINKADSKGFCPSWNAFGCPEEEKPGFVYSAGICSPGLFPGLPGACLGASYNDAGHFYLSPGIGSPGPSYSIMHTDNMQAYCSGYTAQGGYGMAAGGNPDTTGYGLQNPGYGLSYGIDWGDFLAIVDPSAGLWLGISNQPIPPANTYIPPEDMFGPESYMVRR